MDPFFHKVNYFHLYRMCVMSVRNLCRGMNFIDIVNIHITDPDIIFSAAQGIHCDGNDFQSYKHFHKHLKFLLNV